jgi:uncharacterized membrane protein YphA (DoxX/SURF4 family)
MLLRRIARPLLAIAFVADGADALRHPGPRAEAAGPLVQRGTGALPPDTAKKLPTDASTYVRVNGAVQVGAGILLALGKAPRLASVTLAATVIPSAVTGQDFWAEKDPDLRAAKRTAFLKDVSLLGGLVIAAADTAGKPSLGWRGRRAAHGAAATVSAALPFGAASAGDDTAGHLREHLHTVAERGRELAATVAGRGAELAGAAREHGPEWAATVRERGTELADAAREHGPELAAAARERGAALAAAASQRGAELADTARARLS